MSRLAWVLGDLSPHTEAHRADLSARLRTSGWQVDGTAGDLTADVLLVWADTRLDERGTALLTEALQSRRPVILMGATITADLPHAREAAGLLPRSWVSEHPSRLRPEGSTGWVQQVTPLEDTLEVTTALLAVEKARDSVEIWVSAPLGLTTQPVVTWNLETAVGTFAISPSAAPPPGGPEALAVARLLHLTLRRVVGGDAAADVRPRSVGLLGFGAIGAEHARAAIDLPGLALISVCDRNSERLDRVGVLAPGVQTTADVETLLGSDADLIVVSTPPDTHAKWAIRALENGKDVVLEKPMAISTEDADRVLASAHLNGRRAVTYQNRRYDPDFLTVRRAVESGQLGDVFHIEAFIGGFGHPCNYWHSDEEVSGGAIYDWGSHIVDQLLTLHPGPIAHVSATEHKRRWFDVTNADHTSLHIQFGDGTEVSFIHSDLAAALKPRWYVLGTGGALTSTWREATVISRTEIGTLAEDRLAVTDSPPDILLHGSTGDQTALAPVLAPRHPFHRELVDDLLYDWPMSITGAQSRRAVAVMESARTSAHAGGVPVEVNGER